jgi:RHS repeat-associated protein
MVVDQGTGQIVESMTYDSWGRITSGEITIVPFGFAGGLYDTDTKLVRFGARDYDPEIGRWVAKEPASIALVPNKFSYAFDDPVNLIDPAGTYPFERDLKDDWDPLYPIKVEAQADAFVPTMQAVAIMVASELVVGGIVGWLGTRLAMICGAGARGAKAMAAARSACTTGQCDDMARILIDELGEGELVTLLPKGRGPLPTAPGVTTEPWSYHTAVRLPNGGVLDPLTNTAYPSVNAWRAAVTGEAEVSVMIGGAVQ